MSPESRDILRKWWDSRRAAVRLKAPDLACGIAIQQTSVEDGEIVTTRIEPEDFYQMPLKDVYKFDNGMVMAFDESGQQMVEFQGQIADVEAKIRASYPNINIVSARWSDDGLAIEPLTRVFHISRRRESVTADEVIEKLRNDPVVVNRIEMAIAEICRSTEEKPDGQS